MRILMLAQFYPPIIGGEERHVRNLSIKLTERGHEVSVATLWQAGLPEYEVEQGIHIHRLKGSLSRLEFLYSETERHHAPPFPDPEALLALRRLVKEKRPDVVHAHNWFIHSYLPLKKLSHAPLILTLHDYSLVCAKKRFMYQGQVCSGPDFKKCVDCCKDHYGLAKGLPTLLMNQAMSKLERANVDMFVPVSQAVAENSGLVGSKWPYRVIPNFVPDDVGILQGEDSEYQSYLEQLPKGDFILFVGDLSRDKGIEVILQAYTRLGQTLPLVLIGRRSPETPTELPPNVRVLESWPHPAVMRAWARCSFGLAPSIWADPCPTVVMEAMAMGRPVIGTRLGGIRDIILDGKTGLLTPPGDVSALQTAMTRLLENEPLHVQMGEAARQQVVELQAKTVVPRLEQVYRENLEKSKAI